MPRATPQLVIDARPRGPGGPLAGELVLGRSVLAHLLDLALALAEDIVVIHARPEEHRRLRELVGDRPGDRVAFAPGPPSEVAAILRTDRLYDPGRLRRAIRERARAGIGGDLEARPAARARRRRGRADPTPDVPADRPLLGAGPARMLARGLCPTPVRPNALTMAAAALMLGGSAVVAFAPLVPAARAATAIALALALVLDTADGHLARLQGTASEFGRWLDALLDELSDMALHAAIAWAAYTRDLAPAWLVLGMCYAMGKYVFMIGNEGWKERDGNTGEVSAPPALPATGPRAWVRGLGHADVRWHLWIVLAALGRLEWGLVAYAVYYPARMLAGVVRKGVRHG